MKTIARLFSPRTALAEITLLSGIALFSSLYLQYVALYLPCRYCYVLRYLTLGILIVSAVGQILPRLAADISTSICGVSLVGVGVSVFLIADELFPTTGICAACVFAPPILGISLYDYSLAFMVIVLGLSLSVALRK